MNDERLREDISRAFEEGQFEVYLQPKFNLATEDVCGAEALVRWQHPDKGLLMPDEFIPYMEESGWIVKLDYYVWDKTCQMIHDWFQAGKLPYSVSFNVSAASLMNEHLIPFLVGLISKYGLSPSFLQMEITEKSYLKDPIHAQSAIQALHDIGFSVIMDDFGSGYSSLNTLKSVKIDALKLDMQFLPIQDTTENDEIILVSVIKMANWLGMSVLAEGVETRRQRDFLQGAGCTSVQGHYYAEAMSQSEYEFRYIYHTTEQNETDDMIDYNRMPKHNLTVLVVDDDEMSREIIYGIFHELYQVHLCASAEEALAYLKKNRNSVKLILIDHFMPGMNGMEFLSYCKKDRELKVIPQIMITSSDDDTTQVEAFRAGAYDYITKPFTKEVVMARVVHVMEISCQTSIFDIIEQKYKQKPELDAATSLLNKVAFGDMSSRLLEMFPGEKQALFVIDIDDFKKVNDKHGHLLGDQVICCVAEELTNAFRKTDLIGRFGGDEFVVLATKIQSEKTVKLKATEIIKAIMFSCAKQFQIHTSISVGLAFSEREDTLGTLFAKADQALYEAKNTGKGKAVVYGETIPNVVDDDRPIVVVCSSDEQTYISIAQAYGEDAGFIEVTNAAQLTRTFEQYKDRIHIVCVDIMEEGNEEQEHIRSYVEQHLSEHRLHMLAICKEGNMEQLREALTLPIRDVIIIPPQIGAIERIMSRSIMETQPSK